MSPILPRWNAEPADVVRPSAAPTRRAPRVVAIVPAHDEEALIEATMRSVERQSLRPERMIVMADNCTDRTPAIVEARRGWELWESVGNRAKKAGALNQAWRRLEREMQLADDDLVLFMDADTELGPSFLASAAVRHAHDARVGGVCGNFHGKPGGGVLGFFQRMEYARFARSVGRRGGRTFVLSGTATLYRVAVLRRLHRERGHLYDPASMVEDYELTLALRHRGYTCLAPTDCRVYTDVMPTLADLRPQRVRWQRGTLEELRRYGRSRVTAPDLTRQGLILAAIASRVLFMAMLALTIALTGGLAVQWQWAALSAVVAVERAVTVRELGWRYALCGLLLVPEELYGILRESYFIRSAWLAARGGSWQW